MLTPFAKSCLEGITRRTVMAIGKEMGRRVHERDITTTEIYSAEEVFLCGTGSEITPVIEVDGRAIGSGQPGPVARELAAHYAEQVRREGVPIFDEA